jgi:hypothetical protein
MDVTSNWKSISPAQQRQFLEQANLKDLPELAALTESQWGMLAGIVGEEAAKTIREDAKTGTPDNPELPAPAAKDDWSTVLLKVAQLRAKIGELQAKVSSEAVDGQKKDMEKANEEKIKSIKESIEKLEKASKKGFWAKLFGWIGAGLAVIAAAVTTAASFGAGAPLLAVAVLGLTVMVLQETGAMEKIIDFFVENPAALFMFGPVVGGLFTGLIEGGAIDKEEAKMALQITLAVGMVALSIASAVASGGASLAGTFGHFAKIFGVVAQITGGLTQMASGGVGIARTLDLKDAEEAKAKVKETEAWLARLTAMLEEEMERLEKLLQDLQQGLKDASDSLSGIADVKQGIVANLSM